MSRKRVHRLHRQEGLLMRPAPPRRRVACQQRLTRPPATSRETGWSMDFISDELASGQHHRLPQQIRGDTGPAFAAKALDQWAGLSGVQLAVRRPGTPTDTAFSEAVGARFARSA